jgi:hypothetical protein
MAQAVAEDVSKVLYRIYSVQVRARLLNDTASITQYSRRHQRYYIRTLVHPSASGAREESEA